MAKRKSVRRRMRRIASRKSFCYIEYCFEKTEIVSNPYFTFAYAKRILAYKKRFFDSYDLAVAHITRIKLNIEKDSSPWDTYTPCKIAEGWYTKTGKEYITKTIELPNEHSGIPQQTTDSGQSSNWADEYFSFSEGLGSTVYKWNTDWWYTDWKMSGGGGWTITSASTV